MSRESGEPYPVTPEIDIETGVPIIEEQTEKEIYKILIDL